MKSRHVLSCNTPGWDDRLRRLLKAQMEVDLLDFEYTEHGNICEGLAKHFAMEFTLDRDPKVKAAHFRHPAESAGRGKKKHSNPKP